LGIFESDWERIDPDSPNRCQGITKHGQCPFKKLPGSNFCQLHGGNALIQNKEKEELRNYRLSKFRKQIMELGNSEEIISLRDEIGILRLLIQEKIEHCADTSDLILVSGPLSDLIMKVEKLVTSCNRLEFKLGQLLDRSKVVTFAQAIVTILGKYIDDETTLEKISSEISEALRRE